MLKQISLAISEKTNSNSEELNTISSSHIPVKDMTSHNVYYFNFFSFWGYWFSAGYFALQKIIYGTPEYEFSY